MACRNRFRPVNKNQKKKTSVIILKRLGKIYQYFMENHLKTKPSQTSLGPGIERFIRLINLNVFSRYDYLCFAEVCLFQWASDCLNMSWAQNQSSKHRISNPNLFSYNIRLACPLFFWSIYNENIISFADIPHHR